MDDTPKEVGQRFRRWRRLMGTTLGCALGFHRSCDGTYFDSKKTWTTKECQCRCHR